MFILLNYYNLCLHYEIIYVNFLIQSPYFPIYGLNSIIVVQQG